MLELVGVVLAILLLVFVCGSPVFADWARKMRRRAKHRRR